MSREKLWEDATSTRPPTPTPAPAPDPPPEPANATKEAAFEWRPGGEVPYSPFVDESETEPEPEPDDVVEVANKTSKEMYAALAKELGLDCRMSENCRCADCQGGYLRSEPEGTGEDAEGDGDGGLGAGTPIFVSEAVGHGCRIL